MRLEFHPDAQEELHDAVHWYEDRSLFAGERFLAAVRNAIHLVLADPLRYPTISRGIRVFRLKKYPFRVYYHLDEEAEVVTVYAIMHEKRRPDYWRRRLT